MKNRESIIYILKNTFVLWFLIVLVIGLTSLFSWYQQNKHVDYIVKDYLPEANLILKIEYNINEFFTELERFSNIRNTVGRQSIYKSLEQKILDIENTLASLPEIKNKNNFLENIKELYKLVEDINRNVNMGLLIEQSKQNILTKIQWLNDDFNNELIALNQELSFQQLNLVKKDINNQQLLLKEIQSEVQIIYQLDTIKEQIRTEIVQFIYELDKQDKLINYENLKNNLNILYSSYNGKNNKASIIPLQQMVNSLVAISSENGELEKLVIDNISYHESLNRINRQKKNIIEFTKQLADDFILNSKDELLVINNKLKRQTEISGLVIISSFIILLFFILIFYYLYVKGSIKKRFEYLVSLVKELNKGKMELDINIIGQDEISEITMLLKKHTQVLQERKLIEKDLQDTQNELIQAAKLAVVGQTMTTLAHEINQPLNAISLYLFNCKRLVDSQDYNKLYYPLNKMNELIERISSIIKRLRQFARKNEQENSLQPIELKSTILEAWSFLELQHKQCNAILNIDFEHSVIADRVLLEQIFVNLFTNSLEACKQQAIINIDMDYDNKSTRVFISDNGIGWQNSNSDKLLQPFYTSKEVGLGLGLTICQRIMQQFNGNLFIASNLNKGATIILEFIYD